MRIHGLCLVKNEADILRQSLQAARAWCDAIYVLDNGSSDGTWELVQELAREDPAIVPWKQEAAPFHDNLRAQIYHAFADRAQPRDWWVRLDADEFYIDDPGQFLRRVPASTSCVWSAVVSYYFSTEEARRYHADPSQFADEVPITERCRHYFTHWSEVRFVRHEAVEPWDDRKNWPEKVLTGRVRSHPERIRYRHFPYRSPAQIERRIATRAPTALSGTSFRHEAVKNWRASVELLATQQRRWPYFEFVTDRDEMEWGWESRVIDASHLVFDAHDGRFVLNEHLMPPIPDFRRPLLRRFVSNRLTRSIRSHLSRS